MIKIKHNCNSWKKAGFIFPSSALFLKLLAVFLFCSLNGRFWTRTCLVPDRTISCLLCHQAGRSDRTILDGLSSSIMRPEPPSGSDPQCSKRSRFSPLVQVGQFPRLGAVLMVCVSVCPQQGQWRGKAEKTKQEYWGGACFHHTQTDLWPRWEQH